MARVRVKAYATIREAVGSSELEVEAEDLQQLLEKLEQAIGERSRNTISGTGLIQDTMVVLVNGLNVSSRDKERFALKDGDEVAVFPPVSGG